MSYVATIGGIPRVIVPFILGWLAQTISLGAVFATCAIVALMAALIIVFTFAKVDRALPFGNAPKV